MDPSLPIPYAPPTCFTQPHLASPHPSTPCLHQPVPASHFWHHPTRQIQPSISTLPTRPNLSTRPTVTTWPLPLLALPGPACLDLPALTAPTLPDPSLLCAALMRHPLRSCRQCSRFLLRLLISLLATTSKKVAIAEVPSKNASIAGNFAFLPEHALLVDQPSFLVSSLCSLKYCSPVDNNILAFMQVNMRNAYLLDACLGNHHRFPIT